MESCRDIYEQDSIRKQVPVGTKMRPSELFGDGTDDFEDGYDKRSLESPMSVLIQTDRPTDQRTDRRMDKASYRDAGTHLKSLYRA